MRGPDRRNAQSVNDSTLRLIALGYAAKEEADPSPVRASRVRAQDDMWVGRRFRARATGLV